MVRRSVIAAALALAVVSSGCGEGKAGGEGSKMERPVVAKPEQFPKGEGKTLAALRKEVGRGGPVLAPSVSQLEPGRNRLGFGLFDVAHSSLPPAPTAIYVARSRTSPARGPFLARYESLRAKPAFQSRSAESDPDGARSVYVADVEFPGPGRYEVLALTRLDDRLVAASASGPPLVVRRNGPVPEVGEPAPLTQTPTRASVGGDVKRIDTRVPPSTMHESNFADVVGRRPAVLLFATPALCQSRVCGPVVDIAEQVKAERGREAEFIHMEIYNDNEVEKGFRPQVSQWRLPTEPWLFAVDRTGRIAARLEGAFSARELERAVDAATRG